MLLDYLSVHTHSLLQNIAVQDTYVLSVQRLVSGANFVAVSEHTHFVLHVKNCHLGDSALWYKHTNLDSVSEHTHFVLQVKNCHLGDNALWYKHTDLDSLSEHKHSVSQAITRRQRLVFQAHRLKRFVRTHALCVAGYHLGDNALCCKHTNLNALSGHTHFVLQVFTSLCQNTHTLCCRLSPGRQRLVLQAHQP